MSDTHQHRAQQLADNLAREYERDASLESERKARAREPENALAPPPSIQRDPISSIASEYQADDRAQQMRRAERDREERNQ